MIAAIFRVLGGQGVAIVGGALAACALLVAVYQSGVNAERKRGEAASLRSELAIKDADLKAAQRATEVANAMASELERSASENANAVEALKDELSKRPLAEQCRLSPADAARLRNVR